jgi:hypothetical protein
MGIIVTAVVVVALATYAVTSFMVPTEPSRTPTAAFDFTASGSSDCLRFLNSSVPTFYVPFTVAANQNYQLIINCTKMPGGANGWTDVYIYRGYWDSGANYTCKAMDLYPILNSINATNLQIKIGQPYVGNFGESAQQSYTVFFVVPPGGQSTFHVTYKPA